MNEAPTFDRRQHRAHAPLPAPINPYTACMHADPYCALCAREGTILKQNHDIEARSWWVRAARVH
jgi:hypothetical protein